MAQTASQPRKIIWQFSQAQASMRALVPAQPRLSATVTQLLGGYAPMQKTGEARNVEVKENTALSSYAQAWRQLNAKANYRCADPHEIYDEALSILKKLPRPSAQDVSEFSTYLAGEQHFQYFAQNAGVFLSAMANIGKGRDFTINTSSLDVPPDFLGYKNCKNISVNGSIGDNGAMRMRRGKMRISENAGNEICNKKHLGTVEVMGNVGRDAGMDMGAGKLIVHGNAGERAGNCHAGIVYIEGDFASLAFEDKKTDVGAFFHKGKLLRIGIPCKERAMAFTVPATLIFIPIIYVPFINSIANAALGHLQKIMIALVGNPTSNFAQILVAVTMFIPIALVPFFTLPTAAVLSYRYAWGKLYRLLHKENKVNP